MRRNSDRARRRWLWELAAAKVGDGGPIPSVSGEITNGPANDELVPTVSKKDPDAHSSSPSSGPGGDGNRDGQLGDFSGTP